MKTNPKVSVIIPNYNHSRFLKQRIDSVLNQSYQDIEVIILDDRSTDNSVQIINTYRDDPRVTHIIVNEQNSGSPFLQWKKGIQIAKGEWVWIAESDDWCEPGLLEELLKIADDKTGISFCQTIGVNKEGKKLWQSRWRYDHENLNGKIFIKKYLLWGNYIVNASMCVFKKEYYYKISEDFMRFKIIGDWVFWIELSALCDVAISAKQLNYFRTHETSTSGLAYTTGLVYTEFLSLVEKLKGDKLISEREEIGMVAHRFYEFINSKRVSKEYYKHVYEQFRIKLGMRIYFFYYKNWFANKVRNPLHRRIKWNQPKFEHFTRFLESDNSFSSH